MRIAEDGERRFATGRVAAAVAAAIVALCLAFGLSGCGASFFSAAGFCKDAAGSWVESPQVEVDQIPAYDGSPSVELNGGEPYFDVSEYAAQPFEAYSQLDDLGRCGPAMAMVCTDIMPTEERGPIGEVKPTGWHLVKYDWVDGQYLYNRCHLIGYQLSGENANDRNLITGTRYMNVEGMQPYEDAIADYVKDTGNHVLYRVTPLFSGDDLLARGVVMEAESVEDAGAGVCFCVFCYNVQPGVSIDYATGDNESDGTVEAAEAEAAETGEPAESALSEQSSGNQGEPRYILNTNSMKFHYPDCPSVDKMSDRNKEPFYGTRDEAIADGYAPCSSCNP